MSTRTCIDLRRTDLRVSALENPYWVTSANIIATACDDLAAILFSFPVAGRNYFLHQMVFELIEAYDSTTPLVAIGSGTIATDAITTGGVVTDVDPVGYFNATDVTEATPGYYLPIATGTSPYYDALVANTASILIVHGAASTVPCICAYISNGSGTFTTGQGRLHILISEMP
jgi:hypothetical protein